MATTNSLKFGDINNFRNILKLFVIICLPVIGNAGRQSHLSSYEVPSSASTESTTYLPLDHYESSTESSTQSPASSSVENLRIVVGEPVSIENYVTSAENLRKRTAKWSSKEKIEERSSGGDHEAQESRSQAQYLPISTVSLQPEYHTEGQQQQQATREYHTVVPLETQATPGYHATGMTSQPQQTQTYNDPVGNQPMQYAPAYQHISQQYTPTQNLAHNSPAPQQAVAPYQQPPQHPVGPPPPNPERTLHTGEYPSASHYMANAAMPIMQPATTPGAEDRFFNRQTTRKRTRVPVPTSIYTHTRIIPHAHHHPGHHPVHHHAEGRKRRGRRGPRRRRPRGFKKRRRGKRPPPLHVHETAQVPAYAPAFVSYGPVFGPPPHLPAVPSHAAPAHVAPPAMPYHHASAHQPTVSYIPIVHHGPGAPPAPAGHQIIPMTPTYGQAYQPMQPSHNMPPSYSSQANVYTSPPGSYSHHQAPHPPQQPYHSGNHQQPYHSGNHQQPNYGGNHQQPYHGGSPQQPNYGGPSLTISVEAPSNQYPSGPVAPPAPMMRGQPPPPRGYGPPSGPIMRGPPSYPPTGPPPLSQPPTYTMPSHSSPNYGAPANYPVASAPPPHMNNPPRYQPVNNYGQNQPFTTPPTGFGHPMQNFGPTFSNLGQPPPVMDHPRDPWATPMGFSNQNPTYTQASMPQPTSSYGNPHSSHEQQQQPYYPNSWPDQPGGKYDNNGYNSDNSIDNNNHDDQYTHNSNENRYNNNNDRPRKYRRRRPNNYDSSGSAPAKNTYWAGEDADGEFDDYKYRKKDWGKFHQRAVNYFTIDNRNKPADGYNHPAHDNSNDESTHKAQLSHGSNFKNVESKPDSSTPSSSPLVSTYGKQRRLRQRTNNNNSLRPGRPATSFDTNYNSPGMSRDPKKTDWTKYGSQSSTTNSDRIKSSYDTITPRRKPQGYTTLPESAEKYKSDPTHEKYPKLTYDSLTRRILPKNKGPTFLPDDLKTRMFETGAEFKKMLSDHDNMRI